MVGAVVRVLEAESDARGLGLGESPPQALIVHSNKAQMVLAMTLSMHRYKPKGDRATTGPCQPVDGKTDQIGQSV